MAVNSVSISGNITRDAQLSATSGGMAILNFSVAVNDRRRNQQTGEWEDVPNFVDCTMFGTRAEKLAQYLTKGTKVCVEGKLHYSSWEKDGQKRSKLDVTVNELEFMSRSQSDGSAAQQPYQPPQGFTQAPNGIQSAVNQAFAGAEVFDSDIPF